MQGYIRLERRFAPYAANVDRDSLGLYASTDLFAPHTWPEILRHRCTVVVGASGTGKSIEFKQQALILQEEGKAAFFCRLEDLATLSLESVLEVGTRDQLAAWLSGADEGWFFLDAIDEAKLVNLRQFEWAVRKVLEIIAPHLQRVHIMISTRPHAWEAYGDLAMLCEKLGLRTLQPGETDRADSDDSEDDESDGVDTAGGGQSEAAATNPAPAKQEILHVLSLAPLGAEHIRTFAGALGVDDVGPFMDEVERANADVFANRPADLPGLIDLWRKSKRIGSYNNVVLQNITIKLKELNPRHQQTAALTPERALRGAERLAAAATFSRRSSFLLPDRSPLDAKVRDELLDPREVLLDWRPAEVQELLGRGLFDESLYGSVRFHHRTAREYLTARWLRRLLGQRKHRRSIKDLLFAKPYGTERRVAVPSLKPVIGWLALWDQDIRDTVLRVDPKLLLEFGDAAGLGPDIRTNMLRDFAARYATQKHTPLRLDLRELRRLADDRLLPGISQLLARYRDHDDVRRLLLRLMRAGKIRNSGPVVLPYATDNGMDQYSRVTAIQTIGVVGSGDEKRQLKEAMLAAPLTDRALLGATIKALYPLHLQLSEIPALLQMAEHDRDSYDILHQAVAEIVEVVNDEAQLVQFLSLLVALLETPPLTDEWCRISRGFAWLMPSAMAAAKVIVGNNAGGPFHRSVVATVFMGDQADHLQFYTGDVHKDSIALLSGNRDLKHAVFWHAVEQRRLARPAEPVTTAWGVTMSHHLEPRDVEDAPLLLTAIRERGLQDDQLVALSALFDIYVRSDQPAALMEQIGAVVAGAPHLEAALEAHLNPPAPTEAQTSLRERMREMDERQKAETERRRRERQEGIEWLKVNLATLAIGEHAREGQIMRNIKYLHGELSKLSKRSSSRWALSRWRLLERDFGQEVARAFRGYCVAYWHMYRPQLRSEIGGDSQQTPWAVIFGLTGLGIEAADDPAWATKLTGDEAILATRYALWELNQLPEWFSALFAAHPSSVKGVLLQEIGWELTQPRSANSAGYAFARLRWTSTDLGKALRDDILELLSVNPAADPTALTEALTVILRNPAALPQSFSDLLAARSTETADDNVKALWLGGLLCIDAQRALPLLEDWVNGGADEPARETRISKVLEHVWGDSFHGFSPEHQSFRHAGLLVRLIKLCHTHVNPADDLVHRDGYTPGLRDHAQEARDRLLKILCEQPGPETYRALLDLSEFHAEEYPKDRMLVLAENRAEADTEHTAWAPDEVDAFAAEAERSPRTQEDLFKLALARLDDLKLDLEEGDESEASLLRGVENEPELRKVIANRLRFAAAGKYTTGSEEELADATRTDIRLHHPEVEARIPIELKIADARHWSAATLREKLEEQLLEQYLREARYGVFLLVRRGGADDREDWPHTQLGKTFNFGELASWLADEAQELVRANPSIDGLAVVAIDLTRR